MDGREAMARSGGSAKYCINRGGFGVGGSGSAPQAGAVQLPSGFRPLSSSSSVGSTFSVEPLQRNYPHGVSMAMSSGTPPAQPVKKKRGRPRKYAPDGAVSLGLSPMSATPKTSSGLSTPTQKKSRGRPPGSGRKQILASIGGWMHRSAGMAFVPHIIQIAEGEDIHATILSFSQQRRRAVCILSATGAVSSVTFRQPASSDGTTRYEGCFEILCLSGSYLVAEEGSPHSRTGGISVSLSTTDGHVIGGAVGVLVAGGPVQVVACSFIYGGCKIRQPDIPKASAGDAERPGLGEKSAGGPSASTQSYTPSADFWHGSGQADQRIAHTGIDLSRRWD